MSGAKLWGRTLEVWQDTITAGPPTEDQDVVFSCLAGLQHTLIREQAEGFAVDSFFLRFWYDARKNVRTASAAHGPQRDHLVNYLHWEKTYALPKKIDLWLVVRTAVYKHISQSSCSGFSQSKHPNYSSIYCLCSHLITLPIIHSLQTAWWIAYGN